MTMEGKRSRPSWRQRFSSKIGRSSSHDEQASAPAVKTNGVSASNYHWKTREPILDSGSFSQHDQSETTGANTTGHSKDIITPDPDDSSTTGFNDTKTTSVTSLEPEVNFWTRGYLQKKSELPDLILAYEALIADEAGGDDKPQPGPGSVAAGLWNKVCGRGGEVQIHPSKLGNGEYFVCSPEQMSAFIEDRIQRTKSTHEWKVPLSQMHIDLQANVRTVVRGLLWAKEAITPILSVEPHASVAWAGVCLMLPLLCNPLEQGDMLIDGLTKVTSAMCRLTVTERLYREEYSNKSKAFGHDIKILAERFELESAGLLADIIEYQARVACQTCRGPLSQYVRDVVKADDWKAILARINEADDSCSKLARALNEQKYDTNQRLLEDSLRSLDRIAAELTDVSKLTLKEVQNVSFKLDDQKVQAILEALDVATYEKHKRVIPKHVEGTCVWFTQHPQFVQWKEAQSGVLWLAADPGCGKSVLSKYLVDEEINPSPDRATCYFFFRDGMAEQQGIERALCVLLHQLFTQKRELVRHALKFYSSLGTAMAKSADGLWEVLLSASRDPLANEIIFVLDALDECEEIDRKDLVQRISDLYLPGQSSTKGRAKFLLTSRPYHDINVSFQELIDKLPNVHLSADQETAAIRKEIDIVVDHRVAMLATTLRLRPLTAELLANKLKAADNRTYLWLRLIFNAIEKKLGATRRDVELLIESIPDSVQKAYADILEQCTDSRKARRIFEILLASQIPLTVQELNIAIALSEAADDDHEYGDDTERKELEIIPHAVFREQVRYICGLFVAIIDDKVYFIHQTAREFLTMERKKLRQQTEIELPLRLPNCHLTMATVCTSCIRALGIKDTEPGLKRFVPYASRYWDMHIAMAVLAEESTSPFESLYAQTLEICTLLEIWWPLRHGKPIGITETAVHESGDKVNDSVEIPENESETKIACEAEQRNGDIAWKENKTNWSNIHGKAPNRPKEQGADSYSPTTDVNQSAVGMSKGHHSAESVPRIVIEAQSDAQDDAPDPDTIFSEVMTTDDEAEISGVSANGTVAMGEDESRYTLSNKDTAEVLCLAFFGLAASLWLSCANEGHLKRASKREPHPPMLQWAITRTGHASSSKESVQLWISEAQPPQQPNRRQRGQSLHKILWEHSHFADLARETTGATKTSTAANDLFAIARTETEYFLGLIQEDATTEFAQAQGLTGFAWYPDCEASRAVLVEAFAEPASSSRSVYRFQQYLQRAGSGGHIWENEYTLGTETLLLRTPKYDFSTVTVICYNPRPATARPEVTETSHGISQD